MSALERFWVKVDVYASPEGCWPWLAALDRKGYGAFYDGYRMRRAYRFGYEALVGPIPSGLELDHLCRNRGCVNPSHLEPVTHSENVRRGGNALKVSCPTGHPYDRVDPKTGGRRCRRCHAVVELGRRADRTPAQRQADLEYFRVYNATRRVAK